MNGFPRKKGATYAACIFVLGTILTGCGTQATQNSSKPSTSTSHPVEGGNINVDMGRNVQTLDPALSDDLTSNEFVAAMYDPLVTYEGSSNKIVADMAESWDVSPDGKTYTFHLRQGVTFWNGDPVTADSYIAEFKRILTKSLASVDSSSLYPIVQGSSAFYNGKSKEISGITAPTPYTLQIKLTKPEPFFLETLTGTDFVAVDPKWIAKVGVKQFSTSKPMGTGAFELKSENTNTYVLTKNPHYFMKDSDGQQLPYLNQITFTYQTNPQLEAMDFQNGTTPFLGVNTQGIPSSSYQTFTSNPKYKQDFVSAVGGDMWYVGLNVTQAPFTNIKVRQAVEYAINKAFIVKLLNNQEAIANQPTPPDAFGYVKSLPAEVNYTYDPAKAKQLLKESGVSLPIHADFYSSNDANTQKIVAQFQSDLQAVGIDLTLHSLSWGSYLTNNGTGKEPSFFIDWNQNFPDAYNFLDTIFATNEQPMDNSTMYSNPQVDQWLNEAENDTNSQSRAQLYKNITVQVMKDATIVPIYYEKYDYIVQPWLHGYYINTSLNEDPLSYLWIDPTHTS